MQTQVPNETVPSVVIPPAFESYDKTLKQPQLQQAIALGAQFPLIVGAVQSLKLGLDSADVALKNAAEHYRTVVSEVHSAKLNRKEATVLLLGLGMRANRISEVLRVAELPPPAYKRYMAGELGFKAVLALDSAQKKGKGKEVKAGTKKPNRKVVIHTIGDAVRPLIIEALAGLVGKKRVKGASTEWALQYRDKSGSNVYVAVTVSPPNAGDENPENEAEEKA